MEEEQEYEDQEDETEDRCEFFPQKSLIQYTNYKTVS